MYWTTEQLVSVSHVETVLPGSHEFPIRSISFINLVFAVCRFIGVGTATLAVGAGSLGE